MTEANRLRIVVVDAQDLFARALEMALPSASGGRIEVVGTAGSVDGAVQLVERVRPDVALVDLDLPSPGALDLIARLSGRPSRPRVVGVADPERATLATEAMIRGAEAMVTKAARPENLLAPVLAVLQGWRVLPAHLLDEVLARARRPGAEILAEIDDATLQLWLLVAEGLELSRIAEQLYVSERTAKRMVSDLRSRLGASSRVQMAAMAGRAGLLDGDWPPLPTSTDLAPVNRAANGSAR